MSTVHPDITDTLDISTESTPPGSRDIPSGIGPTKQSQGNQARDDIRDDIDIRPINERTPLLTPTRIPKAVPTSGHLQCHPHPHHLPLLALIDGEVR